MQLYKRNAQDIAIIDPTLQYGDVGQYVKFAGTDPKREEYLRDAKERKCEIRYYCAALKTARGEDVPFRVLFAEVPPGHIQPFHTHEKIHEVLVVCSGEITSVVHPSLTEKDVAGIRKHGQLVTEGSVAVSEPGDRHTIANLGDEYASILFVQSPRGQSTAITPDWIRS